MSPSEFDANQTLKKKTMFHPYKGCPIAKHCRKTILQVLTGIQV